MKIRAAATIAVLCALAIAAPASASMGKIVTVASGKLGKVSWAFGVVGGNGQRCYADAQSWPGPAGSGYWESSNGRVCEEASAPRGEWRPVSGVSFDDMGGIELYQTAAHVHFLELLLSDPSDGASYQPEWRLLRTRALTTGQRAKAKLGPGFRFAAVADPRRFCIAAVRTFDRDRRLLRERKVPCEY